MVRGGEGKITDNEIELKLTSEREKPWEKPVIKFESMAQKV